MGAIRSALFAILAMGYPVFAANKKPVPPASSDGTITTKATPDKKPAPPESSDETITTRATADDKPAPPASSEGTITTKATTEVSGYADTDHVYVASPSLAATVSNVLAGWSISGHYLVDVVSAASVDIVSTASPGWHEVRQAGSGAASMKIGDTTLGASGVFSSEPDYFSIAGGGTITVDLLDKNVTPFVGGSYGADQVGRTGLPREFWRDKTTLSGQLGVTWVVGKSTIASLQADLFRESGYLAKPYRYVPLFAPGQGASIPPGASIAEVNSARLSERPAEQLPSLRNRIAVTTRLAHRFSGSTLRLDERAYTDSWGLSASTTELRFLVDVGRSLLLWPHLRFHGQDHTVFWQRAYEVTLGPNGAVGLPSIRTGDRELGPLYTLTGGGGIRWQFVSDIRAPWSVLFEVDGSYTRYLDALYISERLAGFSTFALETEF